MDNDMDTLSEDDCNSDQITNVKTWTKKDYIRRKSIKRKGYRPLSSYPSSPPSSKKKAKYWECLGEKALKSPMASMQAKYKLNESAAIDAQATKRH
ncbi:hypothetical protein G5I_13525 [Acromyrmex echinatior]|uniref:Uncharacterized protein n=1 Tax=Acromyrmex echinatior TaxID=103372 RepID=F4X598_ACREC|nr:hypothetical protein G5I_13525 [Acromyrmex echinatior]